MPRLAATMMVLVAVQAARSGAAPLFSGLGTLPGDGFGSGAHAISGDGRTIVGGSAGQLFRWTPETGMEGLGDSPSACTNFAAGVSRDGSIVIGLAEVDGDCATFRWAQGAHGSSVSKIIDGVFPSDVSEDGSVVVGDIPHTFENNEAFRWTEAEGAVGLGDLPGGFFDSGASAVSGDGLTIVGWGNSSEGYEAFRWRPSSDGSSDGIMLGLGELPGGGFGSFARGVSMDGDVIVGSGISEFGGEAFRWTEETGFVALGDLPGGAFSSHAFVVSADGSIVAGVSDTGILISPRPAFPGEAFIWDQQNGMRNLREVLMNEFGLGLAGWTLISVGGISDDGLTLTGTGINPAGEFEAWIAVIPEPGTGALVGVGLIVLCSSRHVATRTRRA